MFIGIASGKGGVGKTTTTIHFGKALYDAGKEVVIIDGNLHAPHVGLTFGVHDFPHTIHKALEGEIQLRDAAYRHASGLVFIPGSLHDKATYKNTRTHELFLELSGAADYFLIDMGIDMENQKYLLPVCSSLIVVVEPTLPSLTEALKVINHANKLRVPVKGVVVNKTTQYGFSAKHIESFLSSPVLVEIPYDEHIAESLHGKQLVSKKSLLKRYRMLANNFLSEEERFIFKDSFFRWWPWKK